MGCMYCGKLGPYSDEHVLTRALSGPGEDWVLHDTVCRDCNALFSRYERRWTSDPDIAMARIAFGPTGRPRGGQAYQFHPSEQMFLKAVGDPILYEVDLLPGVISRLRYQIIYDGVKVFPAASDASDIERFAHAWKAFTSQPEITLHKSITKLGTSYLVGRLNLADTPRFVKIERRAKPAAAWWDMFDADFVGSAHSRLSLDPFSRIRFRTLRLRQITELLNRIFTAGQITSSGATHQAGEYQIQTRSTMDLDKTPRAVAKTLVNYMADRLGPAYLSKPAFRPILDYCLGGSRSSTYGPFVGILNTKTGVRQIDELPLERHLLHLVSNGVRIVGLLKLYGTGVHRVHLGPAPVGEVFEHTTEIDYNGPGRVAK